ncbi:hypothetical protein C8E08_4122 [Paracidovorax citrulli]|nr:hypothetical protein C8E08_4122 [Paracidovorax citrulli]QCX09386.1 hypothetical protein APS58_0431 [Paracidovorax citrulli]REG69131.1 hypothetical protein C8E07_2266 [Paracidovorax citrulli]RLJ93686.1 hypothetical protein C8E06_2266 [Paracidovorax citrulli]SDK76072.1 hypothetical protein SAMN04489709_1235 [Paracidovorax citrulli]
MPDGAGAAPGKKRARLGGGLKRGAPGGAARQKIQGNRRALKAGTGRDLRVQRVEEESAAVLS